MPVKRIMRYLKGTYDFGLYYKRIEKFELNTYTDADWGGNIDDRKNTSGGAFFLGIRLVTWNSKKKSCTSQSTAEANYVVATINCTNIVWIKHLLKGMKEEIIELVMLYCDKTSAINISKNPVMHAKTKNIVIKYHYVRELVELKMEYVNSKEQIADIFTKPLPKDAFEYLKGKLGVIPLSKAV